MTKTRREHNTPRGETCSAAAARTTRQREPRVARARVAWIACRGCGSGPLRTEVQAGLAPRAEQRTKRHDLHTTRRLCSQTRMGWHAHGVDWHLIFRRGIAGFGRSARGNVCITAALSDSNSSLDRHSAGRRTFTLLLKERRDHGPRLRQLICPEATVRDAQGRGKHRMMMKNGQWGLLDGTVVSSYTPPFECMPTTKFSLKLLLLQ